MPACTPALRKLVLRYLDFALGCHCRKIGTSSGVTAIVVFRKVKPIPKMPLRARSARRDRPAFSGRLSESRGARKVDAPVHLRCRPISAPPRNHSRGPSSASRSRSPGQTHDCDRALRHRRLRALGHRKPSKRGVPQTYPRRPRANFQQKANTAADASAFESGACGPFELYARYHKSQSAKSVSVSSDAMQLRVSSGISKDES